MFTDTEILNFIETQQPGVRQGVTGAMQAAGVAQAIPACGLCRAPVQNGCAHVVPFAAARVSLRQMVSRACQDCGHTWMQPSPTGACTKCGSRAVQNTAERVCNLPRS